MDSLVGRTVAPDLGSHWVSYTSCGSDGGKPLSNYDSARMNCCLASSAHMETMRVKISSPNIEPVITAARSLSQSYPH